MPKFSQSSIDKLATCHVELRILFNEVIKHFDCQVLEGHRGREAQETAVLKGNSKLHWPEGKHNTLPSNAVDVAPYPVDWKKTGRFYWFAGFVMGTAQRLYDEGRMNHKIRYGGDWDSDQDITDQTFNDLVHFEIVP
jgi:peptidoglycan L-alanyl-D-glutamate endopeptidase CwlK